MRCWPILVMMTLLTGCSGSGTGIADSSCDSFRPISMSKQDTEPTRRQIVGHNRAYDAICKAKQS